MSVIITEWLHGLIGIWYKRICYCLKKVANVYRNLPMIIKKLTMIKEICHIF